MFLINLDKESPERFDFGKFFNYTDNFDPIDSDFIYNIKSLALGGKIKITAEVGRPDRLSYKIYNTYEYWWVIMLYNDIQNVDDITSGMTLDYPDSDELDVYYFNLKRRELANQQ